MHNGASRANRLRAPVSVRTAVFYEATLDSRSTAALAHRRLAVLAGRLSAVLARLLYTTLAGGRPCCAAPSARALALKGPVGPALDSGASRCFFRDRTALEPLARPVAVSLADPSGGPVIATSSTVLPCPAVPSGTLSGLHLPSFSTNLVAGCALQDGGVHQFTPAYERVTHCTCARTGRHLATFTRQPGSDLYTLTTGSPQVTASASASASGQLSAPCSCRSLAHETVLWHHRLGHPSVQRLRAMHSRYLVSGLPRVLPPLPPSPAPPCLPCVEGRQRAAPHSSSFPPTTAPLQTLHMDVWGPARVRGQGQERYFLIVVDDYSRYTTVFPLRTKGEVPDVLIPWIRRARLQLSERFHSDFPVLRLHSDRGGEFSSDLLAAYCAEHGIEQLFTLPASPQQNGVAERRIGLVMEVARTSLIHAAAPHFLWPFAVRYAAHQLNLWPRVSLPETSPTLLWTGEVGDASRFRFYHATSRRVLPSQDVTFDESVPYYRLFPYRTAPLPPPPLFLTPGAAVVDPLPPQGAASSGVSQVDPVEPVEVAVDSRPAAGVEPGGAEPGGAEPGGAEPGGAEPGGAEPGGAEPGGAAPEGAESGGAEPGRPEPGSAESGGPESGGPVPPSPTPGGALSSEQLREWYFQYCSLRRGTSGARRTPGAGAGASPPRRELPSRDQIRAWYERRCTLRSGVPGVTDPGATGTTTGAEDPGAGAATGAVELDVGAAAGLSPGGRAESGGPESGGPVPTSPTPGGALSSEQLREWYFQYCSLRRGTSGARRTPGAGAGASPPRRELPSRDQIRAWYERRCTLRSGAPGVTGAGAATGAVELDVGAAAGAEYPDAGTTAGAEDPGAGAAPGGVELDVGAAAGAEYPDAGAAAGAVEPGVGATTGSADPGAGAAAGAVESGVGAATGAGDPDVGAAAGAEDPGAGDSARSGVAARRRPYFVPLLQQSQLELRPASPLPALSPYTEPPGGLAERREPASRPVSPVRTARTSGCGSRLRPPRVPGTHRMSLRLSTAPLRVPLPSPPESSLPVSSDPESDSLRAASPTVPRLLATVVTDPSFESTAANALVSELVDFAARCRLDYAASLVAASASVCPPSVGGECALGTDVLEDRQEEFQCLAAASPHLVSVLLTPEGDPDALDIPTPRSYAEAIEGPYSSQWQAAMDAEMASWKSTGTYVDAVPPPGANIVSGMWIFRVKRPPGSPPAFKARYVARGFSQRHGVDYFQTSSPTPKMTTLRVLLHVAAHRDYELHSLDFSTAFLQGSLHEEIWLRRPLGFTGTFPPGTQWSLRRPVYGLRQAPREWHDTLRTTLAALGFAPSTADPSLLLCFALLDWSSAIVTMVDPVVIAGGADTLEARLADARKRHADGEYGTIPVLIVELGIRSQWATEHPSRPDSPRPVQNEGGVDDEVDDGARVNGNDGTKQRGVIKVDGGVDRSQARVQQSVAAADSSHADADGRRRSPLQSRGGLSATTHVTAGGIAPTYGYFKFSPDRITIAPLQGR
ncbi:unnamed protein product [Closterium sp. NIES-53]